MDNHILITVISDYDDGDEYYCKKTLFLIPENEVSEDDLGYLALLQSGTIHSVKREETELQGPTEEWMKEQAFNMSGFGCSCGPEPIVSRPGPTGSMGPRDNGQRWVKTGKIIENHKLTYPERVVVNETEASKAIVKIMSALLAGKDERWTDAEYAAKNWSQYRWDLTVPRTNIAISCTYDFEADSYYL